MREWIENTQESQSINAQLADVDICGCYHQRSRKRWLTCSEDWLKSHSGRTLQINDVSTGRYLTGGGPWGWAGACQAHLTPRRVYHPRACLGWSQQTRGRWSGVRTGEREGLLEPWNLVTFCQQVQLSSLKRHPSQNRMSFLHRETCSSPGLSSTDMDFSFKTGLFFLSFVSIHGENCFACFVAHCTGDPHLNANI